MSAAIPWRRLLTGAFVSLLALACDDAPSAVALPSPQAAPETLEAPAVVAARAATERDLAASVDAQGRAAAHGRLAMFYQAQTMLIEADAAYGRAIAEVAEPRWYYLRAVARNERGDVAAAIDDFRRVLALLPTESAPLHALASYRLGVALLFTGEALPALPLLQSAQAAMPTEAAVQAAIADVHIALADWPSARSWLQRAYETEPGAGQVAYKLAQVSRQLGDLEAARGWLLQRNDVAASITDPFLLEVAAFSQSPNFHINAGERAMGRGDYTEALGAFRNAQALAPADVDIALRVAQALALSGQHDDALTTVREQLAKAPQSARGWATLAWLLRAASTPAQLAEAEAAATQALSLNADDARTRALRAGLRLLAGQWTAAVDDYVLLVEADPANALHHYYLALARLRGGACAESLPSLGEALRLRSSWGEAHVVLARAQALCGDASTRQQAYGRAQALLARRNDDTMRVTLALTAYAAGRSESARAALASPLDAAAAADAALLEAAIKDGTMPSLPFATTSQWWRAAQLR